jgi:hypothetical protein
MDKLGIFDVDDDQSLLEQGMNSMMAVQFR